MAEVDRVSQKIHTIMSEVGTIPKNGYNQHFKYEFVAYDDIVERIRDLMAEHRVVSYHKNVAIGIDEITLAYDKETGAPSRVKSLRTYSANVVYEDIDSGDVLITGPFFGEADLIDDKSIRKAERQASKIADLTTFKIATGEPDLGEIVSEPKEEKGVRDLEKARAKKAPAKPKAKSAPNKTATPSELTELQVKLANKYGSKDKAVAAGNEKFKGTNWTTDVEKMKELLEDG